ncbi:MAG: nucleoside triphosphate pyrophosphohydrolase [Micromonosporaceae bacterium]
MEGTTKLVRDRIPELIKADGEEPKMRIASDEEYPALLRLKLLEEVQEFLDSDDPTELVDVVEVVRAIAKEKGVNATQLEKLRKRKEDERGGFNERAVLVEVLDEEQIEPEAVEAAS